MMAGKEMSEFKKENKAQSKDDVINVKESEVCRKKLEQRTD